MPRYASDFGGTKRAVATVVADLLRGEGKAKVEEWLAEGDSGRLAFKVRHLPYDWSTNASRTIDYRPGDNKKTVGSCVIA